MKIYKVAGNMGGRGHGKKINEDNVKWQKGEGNKNDIIKIF